MEWWPPTWLERIKIRLFSAKNKKARHIQEPFMLGRQLIIVDPQSYVVRFLPRDQIPPQIPVHFPAKEPFTILGISSRLKPADVCTLARDKERAWLSCLIDVNEYEREVSAIHDAADILGDNRSCILYKAFAKKYHKGRTQLSRSKIQRNFISALITMAPVLKKRQTSRNIESGGIFATSLLVAIVMLIAVLTIPVGGISILGFSLFANSLFVAWGPAAIIPAIAFIALGGLGAYWYKQHKEVFVELQVCLGYVLEQMEALAYAVEDVFMLHEYHLYQDNSSNYKLREKDIRKRRDAILAKFVEHYVEVFTRKLSSMMSDGEEDQQMSPEQFFAFITNNPEEIRQCFHHSLSELLIENRNDLLTSEVKK